MCLKYRCLQLHAEASVAIKSGLSDKCKGFVQLFSFILRQSSFILRQSVAVLQYGLHPGLQDEMPVLADGG